MSHKVSTDASGDPGGNCKADRHQLVVLPSERDHRQGSLTAQVLLVEYGDYQCSQRKELYLLIKATQQQFNAGSVEKDCLCFVFRHFPQSQIYPQAQKAAAAPEAAGEQGQFWQMHELLLKHQKLGDGYLAEYAYNLGLDVVQFI